MCTTSPYLKRQISSHPVAVQSRPRLHVHIRHFLLQVPTEVLQLRHELWPRIVGGRGHSVCNLDDYVIDKTIKNILNFIISFN